MKKIIGTLGMILSGAVALFAQTAPSTIVELPASFAGDAKLTLTTAFGVILSVLVVVWVIRKIIKTTNRS